MKKRELAKALAERMVAIRTAAVGYEEVSVEALTKRLAKDMSTKELEMVCKRHGLI